MIGLIGQLTAKINSLALASRCAVLLVVLVATFAAAAPVAYGRHGIVGLQAVAIAVVVCGGCSLAALVLAMIWHGTPNGVVGALAGSLVGMFPPLAVGMMLQSSQPALAEAGAFIWILVFYLVALVVKTLLVAPAAGVPVNRNFSSTEARSVGTPSTNSTQAGA